MHPNAESNSDSNKKTRSYKTYKIQFLLKKYHFLILVWLELLQTNVSNSFNRKLKIVKTPLDKNTYHTKTLSNGIEILMIVKKNILKSSCALSVRTGSYDDTIPGIAHFLEHMLFMGSDLSQENVSFDEYIQENCGTVNAVTDKDQTIFFLTLGIMNL